MNTSNDDFNPLEGESIPTETDGGTLRSWTRHHATALLLVGLLAVIIVVLVLTSFARTTANPLYPVLPTFTIRPASNNSETASVTFSELNSDPSAYRDQLILVTGDFTPLPPEDCRPWTGVPIQWSLVSEGLQLNARGFENILHLVNPGTELTVTGYWRLYQGPLGCGKAPEPGVVWYLDVIQIIEPNPLLTGSSDLALTVIANSPLPTLGTIEALLTPSPTPTTTMTPEILLTATLSIQSTPQLPGSPTETPTFAIPPTVTDTPDPNATVTPESTSDPVLTPGGTPTITGAATETPDPLLPTNTPGGPGYPPNVTNTPTGGYP
jgi:hypothetical protein